MTITVCYNKIRTFETREEAKEYYLLALLSSEGSEQERYSRILADIYDGKTVCTDEY